MMINFIKKVLHSTTGSSMLQVMLITAAVGGGGAYMLKTTQTQNKVAKSTVKKGVHSVVHREFAQAFSDTEVCLKTLDAAVQGPLTGDMDLQGIMDKDNKAMYSHVYPAGDPNGKMYGWRVRSLKLDLPEDYVPSDPMKFQPAELLVMMTSEEEKAYSTGESTNNMQSFGGRDFAVKIPLYLVTYQKKIMTCMSDDGEAVRQAIETSCQNLGGTYNPVTAICENLRGDQGHVKKMVSDYFCSIQQGPCSTHPYNNEICEDQPDPRGETHGNWVIQSFAANGDLQCACLPLKTCENKDDYCKGTDLGTDGCFKDCGFGTKEGSECATCTETDWTPLASTKCSGETFTQTSNCGNTKNEVGTKDCSCTVARPKNWTETISGVAYTCEDEVTSGSTVVNHKDTLNLKTSTSATNQGSASYYCNAGKLEATSEKCSSTAKKLVCGISYQYRIDKGMGSIAANGTWSQKKDDQDKDCDDNGCGFKVGINCTGEAEARIYYQYMEFSTASPEKVTPWSGTDNVTKWGEWSILRQNHPKDECDPPRKCGLVMRAETSTGQACTVSYQFKEEKTKSTMASNGVWSTLSRDAGDDKCEKNACGIRATIDCGGGTTSTSGSSGGGGGGGGSDESVDMLSL